MSEREFSIEPYGVAFDCETCGEEMKPTSEAVAWLTQPVQFPHECPNGHQTTLPERYPTVRWRHTPTLGAEK
jgi:hypothetical protein